MSGAGAGAGRLVVLERGGRGGGRALALASGAATVGRAAGCDLRVLQPAVAPHHCTLVVHHHQTIVRHVGPGQTLVNGSPVSVAALRHGDTLTVGTRALRWEYDRPPPPEPSLPAPRRTPALIGGRGATAGAAARGARGRRATAATAADAQVKIRKTLEIQHRASMPASAGGKQVAIVQPQRRDAADAPGRAAPAAGARSPARARSRTDADDAQEISFPHSPLNNTNSKNNTPKNTTLTKNTPVTPKNTTTSPKNATLTPKNTTTTPKSTASPRSSAVPQNTTKATLWIESRKSSPKKAPPARELPRRAAASAKKTTPLRLHVLRKAQSAHKPRVTKIEDPLKIDAMKQAALLLMAGHTRLSGARPPALLVKRSSGGRRPRGRRSRGSAGSRGNKSVSVLEITDSTVESSPAPRAPSPLPPSPRKSALKDPAAKRKNESIKFDLSNLDTHRQEDISMVSALSRPQRSTVSKMTSDEDLTLHYSDSSSVRSISPSPRRSIHSRASLMLEKVGSPLKDRSKVSTPAPQSPTARRSYRGSAILQKALDSTNNETQHSRRTTRTLTDQSLDSTAESAFRTRTLSPRSPKNMESYSVVDLVSMDSSAEKSVYDSVGSTRSSSIMFGTPRGSSVRKTRSTIDPNLLKSSTPYVGKPRASIRSNSSANVRKSSPNKATRRSQSLTTPENSEETQKHISINSTRLSRASRSRSRLRDSDLQLLNSSVGDSDSPRTSRRNTRADNTIPSPKTSLQSSPATSQKKRKSPSILTLNTTVTLEEITPLSSPRSQSQSSRKSKESNVRANRSQNSITISPKSPRLSTKRARTSTPQSSPKPASPKKSPIGSSRKGSRLNLTFDMSKSRNNSTFTVNPTSDGMVTPENTSSPPAAGTPVLSIQNLLDSSQNSFASQKSPKKTRGSVNIKRKTIGVLRSGGKAQGSAKSKSFTASARRSLRALRLSPRAAAPAADDENVTPKSAVKLVQEAVKNKHSTAKKPLSKRSIIDNLNESDIVKQLFNSPVKRKLSQSMTEFSRKKLFDEEENVPRRPTRNTVALSGRTPDNSILDNTDRYTPENFVSPLSTPSNSPNLTGIKRLYKRNTPQNDLSKVQGVKKLLRTPRTRKSVRNDLTNVAGVKAIFAKSPKNRLSDVRVKEVFVASPKNDLRRVTGVKSLFQSQKKRKSPRNDLSDVRGVKKLFTRKSVANDLRNVSGVKTALQQRSPRNDLRDVRGVKQMFREERRVESPDLSGVEELFNESNASTRSPRSAEALFDRLVGKPVIKTVYSKSFISKQPARRKIRRNSLRKSIELITNNVEEWIQQELEKNLKKDKLNESRKANITRELQRLATDTVEGTEIRTSRVRNSTLVRSATEAQHTLPLKKRSFVEASLERSGDQSRERSRHLPIKKRAVVHSTPVKGRVSVTMNASELGRVSPIAALDKTRHVDNDAASRSKQQIKTSPHKSKRVTRTLIIEQPLTLVVEEKSPPAKPGRKSIKPKADSNQSPTQKRTTRNAEEAPASPKAKGRKTKEAQKPQSPKRGRNTRVAEEIPVQVESPKAKTPRKGRQTKTKLEEAPIEKSPKPKRGRSKASIAEAVNAPPAARKTRNNAKKHDPKESPKKGRNVKAKTVIENDATVEKAPTRQGRAKAKNVDTSASKKASPKKASPKKVEKASPKKTRGTRAKASPVKASPKPARGARNKAEVTDVSHTKKRRTSLVITKKAPIMSPKPAATRRTRKAEVIKNKSLTPKKVSPQKPTSPTKASRRNEKVEKPKSPSPKKRVPRKSLKVSIERMVLPKASPKFNPRGKKVATESVKSPVKQSPPKRSRRAAVETAPEPKKTKNQRETKKAEPKNASKAAASPAVKRGRAAAEDAGPPAKRGRGKKDASPKKTPTPKPSPQKTATPKKTRGKPAPPEPTKPNRRTKEVVAEPPRGRKRKTTEDISPLPAKIAKNETKPRGRATAAKLQVTSPRKSSPVKGTATRGKKADKSAVKREESTSRSRRPTKASASPAKAPKPAKKAAAKKSPAKKSPAKKSPAKKSPVKKSAAKKSPTKKVAAAATKIAKSKKVIASPVKVKSTRSRRR